MSETITKPNGKAMFNMASAMTVRAGEGVPMEVRHCITYEVMHNADGTPVTITMRGQSSKAFRQAVLKMNRIRADKQMTAEQIADPDHIYETDTMLLAACTAGWNFDELFPGEPFPYSEENALKLWNDERFHFLRVQATVFMLNNGNFLQAPSEPSSVTPDTSSDSTNLSPDQLAAE